MKALVAYASKHGTTNAIAKRIADGLSTAGQAAEAKPVQAAGALAGYDAYVVGSAAYVGSWLKDATEFVRDHQAVLATKPVWLFNSRPLGTEPADAQDRDKRVATEPKEFAELNVTIRPRRTRVFFGALDPSKLGFRDRAIRTLPAGRALLPEGDFRDWQDIDAWAASIGAALAPVPAGGR